MEKPVTKNKLSWLSRFILFFNWLAVALLCISYLAPYVSPANFWYIAFAGLAYPLLLIINLLFMFYWLARARKLFIISLLVIVAGWPQLRSTFQLNLFSGKTKEANQIKVVSYNVRLFDLYNWTHNKTTRNKIFNYLYDENPDIVCFQEYFQDDTKDFNTTDTLKEILKAPHAHTAFTFHYQNKRHWGIAVFSRFPIINQGVIELNSRSNNICIYADVKIKEDTIRVFNMHLQSMRFHQNDYKYLDKLAENTEENYDHEKSKSILIKIKQGFVKRSEQVEIIADHIKNSPYPVIVCGDFNDTPASYAYHTISQNLKDAFIESGNGMGISHTGKFFPFRIDYILHSSQMQSSEFITSHENLSDHYPVSCYLTLKE